MERAMAKAAIGNSGAVTATTARAAMTTMEMTAAAMATTITTARVRSARVSTMIVLLSTRRFRIRREGAGTIMGVGAECVEERRVEQGQKIFEGRICWQIRLSFLY